MNTLNKKNRCNSYYVQRARNHSHMQRYGFDHLRAQ